MKVDSVAGNNATQSINMYWGNASAGDASDSRRCSAADSFVGVWHLDEDGSTTAGGYKDASAAGNHGTGVQPRAAARAWMRASARAMKT